MIGESIGLYDVNTGASLTVERYAELGHLADGTQLALAYTTASHGRLVQIRSGSMRVTYDVDGQMIDEDADRIGRLLGMIGENALKIIRNLANT